MANKSEMGFTTVDLDSMFNGIDRGVQIMDKVAQTVGNAFGGADSRRNDGGYYQPNNYTYGYGAPQPQPVQYGYGYAASNPNYNWGTFGGYNNMYESNYDGFWNPAYGQMNGGY